MNPSRGKAFSILIVFVAVVGILLSLFFLYLTWRFRKPATNIIQSGIHQTSGVLRTTADGLVVMNQIVSSVYSTTIYLDESTRAISETIQSTSSFMDSAGTFIGDDLINTITNTQSALDSAQASAKVIDNILSALSNVPLIGFKYNPALPLNSALGKVSSSLDPLQSTLTGFQSSLESTRTNLQQFSGQIRTLNQNILVIKQNLIDSRTVIENYQAQVASLQSWMKNAEASSPGWITLGAWIVTIFIFWLILIQVSLLLQGINQLSNKTVDTDNTPKHTVEENQPDRG